MKIFEIATGFTPIPARIGAATEIIVENLIQNFTPENDITLVDVYSSTRQNTNYNLEEIKMPDWLMKPAAILSVKHKIKRVVYSIKLAFRIKKINKKESGAILHFHNQYNFAFSFLLTFLLKKKYRTNSWVYTVHSSLWFDKENNKPTKKHCLEIYSIKRADIIICLNPQLAENLKDYFPKGLFGKIVTIPNGVNAEVYYPVQKEQADNQLKLINVGSLYDGKNQLETLRIITPYLKSNACMFYFAGANADPVYMNEINSYIESNRLTQKAVYLGEFPPGKALNEAYNMADVYISNSKSEGFSLVVLEAMAAGLPVLLSESFQASLKGTPETEAIRFCNQKEDFQTAIDYFLENKTELKTCSLSARKYIETYFSWKQIAVKHQKVFRKNLPEKVYLN